MRRRTITAFALVAALAFTLVSGEMAMTVNAAENAAVSADEEASDEMDVSGDAEVSDEAVPEDTAVVPMSVSGGDAVGGSTTETTGKTQLAAPTGVQWGEKGVIQYNAVENAEGYYALELYRDGERSYSGGVHYGQSTSETILDGHYREYINESGDYQFRVRSRASYDSENYTDSEWSELSSVYHYVRPDRALGTTVCYWSDTEPGTICWQPVEGAGGYHVTLYQVGDSGDRNAGGTSSYSSSFTSRDFSDIIERMGAGKYYCIVKALSGDIEVIANGVEGTPSEYYDTTVASGTISGIISDAVEGATPAEALETIKSEIDKASLRMAMQTDNTVLNQIKELESTYAAEQGITINAPTVSAEAGAYVKADEIAVVGAGLNAAAGQEVRLEVSVPAEKEYVPDQHYANSVQLDIQLKRAGESVHELDIPVTITLPIPRGVDAKRLVILHYSEDGSFETVNSRNNGDGTVTFTVSHFSTFAFAEQKSDSEGGDNVSWGSGDDHASDAQEDIVDWIVNANSGDVIQVKGVTALSNAVMQELLKKGDVTLVLEYTYEGVDYVVTIPAGAAVDDDISWYGPLYLAGRYGNGYTGTAGAAGSTYTVQSGDTMTKIARAHGMTLSQLAAKNPQVKNINYIVVGQKINVR